MAAVGCSADRRRPPWRPAYLQVNGGGAGGYDAISKYHDFKEGVKELAKDAQEYESALYHEVLKLTGETKADSVAKRDMTPGRLARVIQKLEEIQELQKNAPDHVLQEELQKVAREVQAIRKDLEPGERQVVDKVLQLGGLHPIEKMPVPAPIKDRRTAILGREDVKGTAL